MTCPCPHVDLVVVEPSTECPVHAALALEAAASRLTAEDRREIGWDSWHERTADAGGWG
jgi:hypothetical protein